MTDIRAPAGMRLPSGVLASLAAGITAAGFGWWLAGLAPYLSTSYTRLDQLTALTLGGTVGAVVAGLREHRQRRRVIPGFVAGMLLGGVGALAGVSLVAFDHGAIGPRTFLLERTLAWAFVAVGVATAVGSVVAGYRGRLLAECVAISATGGAIAGVLFTLPGAADVWQAMAILWLGGVIGVAIAGPELWRAVAVIELLPARDERWQPLQVREWPLSEGIALALGEAQLACRDGRVSLYPPAGGALADGHLIRSPRILGHSVVVAIGRNRYAVQLQRPR